MAGSTPGAGTSRLALKIFLVALAAVALVAGTWALVRWSLAPEPDRQAVGAVSRGAAAFATKEGDRYARLGLAARVLAREPSLLEVLGAGDGGTTNGDTTNGGAVAGSDALTDLLSQRRDGLGYDFALVVDGDGRVAAATDHPEMVGLDLSQRSLVSRGLEDGGGAHGVWLRQDGRMAHAALEWVAPDFELLGYVVVGRDLDDVLALQLQRTSGAEVAFLAPLANASAGGVAGRSVGASMDPSVAQRLAAELAGDGGLLADRDAREGVEVDLGGGTGGSGSYEALLAPLRDAAGEPVGALLVAAPLSAGSASAELPWLIGAVVVALLAALLLASLLARSALAPVDRLTGMVEAAPQEGFARRPEPGRAGHLAPLAGALRRLFRDLQEERTLAATAAAAAVASWPAGDTLDSAGSEGPRLGKPTLVGVDLRRYARLDSEGASLRDTAERLRRDEARVRSLVAAHSGRLLGGAGHRWLAAFEDRDARGGGDTFSGDEGTWRALTAGAAILSALGERDNAFDDGDPPAVAVASGRAASGTGGGGRPFLVGPAVQLVESLLREASPGELVMNRPVHRAVGERLEGAGIAPEELRGLLSPQPLFVLRGSAVGRLAAELGAVAEAPVPGEVLEDRYEILATRGGSSAGPLFLARDRDLGREVALKQIRLAGLSGEGAASGVDREGALAAIRRFSHPHVAEVFALQGEAVDSFSWTGAESESAATSAERVLLVREWVAGAALQVGGSLPLPATLGLGRQLAGALAAIHGAGLVHGRVKPENVLLVPGAGIRLTDLGVGTLAGSAPSASAAGYLRPPEQALDRLGDARSDIYAFGSLLARLASGRWWTDAAGEKVANQGADEDAADGLPDGLEDLLRRCLAAEPDARPADGGELVEALARVTA